VRPLLHLGQLLRIPKQNRVPRRSGHGNHVGQRHLAGLVNEDRVDLVLELAASPEPRRARGDVYVAVPDEAHDLVVGLGGPITPARLDGLVLVDLANSSHGQALRLCVIEHRVEQVGQRAVREGCDGHLSPGA